VFVPYAARAEQGTEEDAANTPSLVVSRAEGYVATTVTL
jgi:hypothetical protein